MIRAILTLTLVVYPTMAAAFCDPHLDRAAFQQCMALEDEMDRRQFEAEQAARIREIEQNAKFQALEDRVRKAECQARGDAVCF